MSPNFEASMVSQNMSANANSTPRAHPNIQEVSSGNQAQRVHKTNDSQISITDNFNQMGYHYKMPVFSEH